MQSKLYPLRFEADPPRLGQPKPLAPCWEFEADPHRLLAAPAVALALRAVISRAMFLGSAPKRRRQRAAFLLLAALATAVFFLWRLHRSPEATPDPTFPAEESQAAAPILSDARVFATVRTVPGCPAEAFVLVVFSRPGATRRRRAIRTTWGLAANSHTRYLRSRPHLFTLRFAVPSGGPEVEEEGRRTGDLLVLPGGPENPAQQLVGLVRWFAGNATARLRCPPSFLLKTEDSVFVNMPAFSHWLAAKFGRLPRAPLLLGHVMHGLEPVRDRHSPHFVSLKDFPKDRFPDHPTGPVLLLSKTAARALSFAEPHVPKLREVGPFLGLLAAKAGLTPEHNEHFVVLSALGDPCHPLRIFFTGGANSEKHLEMFSFCAKPANVERCARRFPHEQRDL